METTIEINEEFRSLRELDNDIDNTNADIDSNERMLFSLITATPKDITPSGEDPHTYLNSMFTDYMSLYRDNVIKIFKLEALKYDDNNGLK